MIFTLFLLVAHFVSAQSGYVHASGTKILDNRGETIIFRGIGTGNWMIQEGYMMRTSGAVDGTEHSFRNKLKQTIGEDRTNQFYEAWLDTHMTKSDVDALASWGFNSIRVNMHYNKFTYPIEGEPTQGKDTWIESGFARLDNLLKWCEENGIYLFLDMHGMYNNNNNNNNNNFD
jgi:aryl-phospho-beta-D-glucosidase BglC (GH1 family)